MYLNKGLVIFRNVLISSFGTGFIAGCIPNKLFITYNGEKLGKFNVPIITGCYASFCVLCSPFILTNYFLNGTYLDKIMNMYEIENIEILSESDENEKNAYPSSILLEIKLK